MSLSKRLQEALFGALWRVVSSRPGTLLGAVLALAVVSGLAAFLFLGLDSNQDRLVSPEVPFHKRYLEHLENFGDQEYLFVVIHTGGSETGRLRAARFSESLADRLRRHPDLVQAIHYRITPEDLGEGALLYASPEDADVLSQTLVKLAPSINGWLADRSLAGFFEQVANLMENGQAAAGTNAELFSPALGFLDSLLGNIDRVLAGGQPAPLALEFADFGARYFFAANGRLLIMRVLPAKDFGSLDVIGDPLKQIRRDLESTRAEFPGIEAGLTGRPALQADEMSTTDRDITRAAIIAILLVGALFMVVLHGWLRPVLVILSLLAAMAWTFGFATVSVGRLNLLSIVFALVLVGIGVDFGVHIVMRYMEGRKKGLSVEEAVRTALFQTGPGVLLGAVTSVCAFYSVLGSDFVGLAELGMIGGTGILFCLLVMVTALPAMLLLAERKNFSPDSTPRLVKLRFIESLTARPGRLLVILSLFSIAAMPGLFRTGFNYNLLELQAQGLESVEYEKLLIEAPDESTWFAILTADSVEEGKQLEHRLGSLPTVGKVETISDFIPIGQEKKVALYARVAEKLQKPENVQYTPAPADPQNLVRALSNLEDNLSGMEEKLFAAGAGTELARLGKIFDHIDSARQSLEQNPALITRLDGLQQNLRTELEKQLNQLLRWLWSAPVTEKDLPPLLRDLHVGRDGRYQVKVFPSQDIWDFDKLKAFVADLRQIDPEASGVPVGVLESARLMHRAFLSAAGLTLALVSLILWIYSRSFSYVLLTLLPLGVGLLWLLELMGWLGLSFNLANFFAIPILIAIGVDGGVHFLARWKEMTGRRGLFSTSTPTAVALSFATTMIGFGGLMFAHHQGLASLGTVMVLGSLTCMLACLLVLPAALKLTGHAK